MVSFTKASLDLVICFDEHDLLFLPDVVKSLFFIKVPLNEAGYLMLIFSQHKLQDHKKTKIIHILLEFFDIPSENRLTNSETIFILINGLMNQKFLVVNWSLMKTVSKHGFELRNHFEIKSSIN